MAVPNIIPVDGFIRDISPAVMYSPYSAAWWTSSYVTRVPETAVGWLVAQGWQIVGTYDEDDVTYYNLARQSMQNWKILQTLLDSYTFSYNEGRAHNSIRYNDILYNYNRTINKTRQQLDVQGDVSDVHLSLYLTTVDELWSEVETETGVMKDDIEASGDLIDPQLALYLTKLNTIDADWTTHAATTRALLVDLGTTETARINEQFDNALAKAKQGLISRGLYSSVLFAQLEARIERERTEALGALNDRLAREKVDNEHKLFMEQMQTTTTVMGGRVEYVNQQMRRNQWLVDTRHKVLMTSMQGMLEKANARLGVRDREDKLLSYQLDTRNNLAIGMFGFQERREDSYPSLESITKLVAGLGESGGGWVTP